MPESLPEHPGDLFAIILPVIILGGPSRASEIAWTFQFWVGGEEKSPNNRPSLPCGQIQAPPEFGCISETRRCSNGQKESLRQLAIGGGFLVFGTRFLGWLAGWPGFFCVV